MSTTSRSANKLVRLECTNAPRFIVSSADYTVSKTARLLYVEFSLSCEVCGKKKVNSKVKFPNCHNTYNVCIMRFNLTHG